ncbi:xanthine dehydrogenase accessory protein XdhC [Azonexus hydrophilus]|uniref:xanthine dehydrogenase accessory protein XdhC n=1 Tax=Azonexus hydrophilus TaxID=418702 RepID=UPI0009E0B559|nr:xanthine dehydrogenase accessory protein XdhC [Azonexus hydrophilus]
MAADWVAPLAARLAAGEDVVLVTVAAVQGSAPRDAGTTMLISASTTELTIGGGHLEWQATAHADRLLAGGGRPQVVRYALGAGLGQCCGGVVWLAYEKIPASEAAAWAQRSAALAGGARLQRRLAAGDSASTWQTGAAACATALLGGPEDWHFVQDIAGSAFPVWVFGAGHVARALIRQLLPLGATVTWIDTRDQAFADVDTSGVDTRLTDLPESEVAQAPAGTFFVVMTHSHTLDFALCEAIFRRRDFAYFGLIGSHSKRASFERRLRDRGLAPDRLREMTCPIGIPGIVGKEPSAIALAVAAELLSLHHARQLLHQAGRPRLSTIPVRPDLPE